MTTSPRRDPDLIRRVEFIDTGFNPELPVHVANRLLIDGQPVLAPKEPCQVTGSGGDATVLTLPVFVKDVTADAETREVTLFGRRALTPEGKNRHLLSLADRDGDDVVRVALFAEVHMSGSG